MTERDALRAITVLAEKTTGRWDEATVRIWMVDMVNLEDADAAEQASHSIGNSWVTPGRPPYGAWLAEYNRIRHRMMERRASLPRGGARMSPGQYIRTLMDRAEQCDAEALTELGAWRRSCWGLSLLDREALDLLGVKESDYRWKLGGR